MTHPLERSRRPAPAPWRALLRDVLVVATLFVCLSAGAQENVDPRTGQLMLTVTDIALRAELITLAVRRTLVSGAGYKGMFGDHWRSNWESRIVASANAVVIDQAPYPVAFVRQRGAGEYRSSTGERLVARADGGRTRITLDGATESYDAKGRLVERDHRNGNKITVRYGADGRPVRLDGPRGLFIQFQQDAGGQVIGAATSLGATVRYAYDGDRLASVQREDASNEGYAYDPRGALTRIDRAPAGAREFAYDAKQRVISRRSPDGSTERFEYDDATRAQRRTDAAGATTVTRFVDARHLELIDPLGRTTTFAYDTAGRLASVAAPGGRSAKFTYDAAGRPIVLQDANGRVTRLGYVGATGRVATIVEPDGTRQSLVYDAQLNLTEVRRGAQSVASFSYYPDGTLRAARATGSAERRLTYDAQGRLESLSDPLGESLRLSYDSRGNPLRAVEALSGATAWQWDAAGRLLSETPAAGGPIRFEYGADGRVATVTAPTGVVTRFRYDVDPASAAPAAAAARTIELAYDRGGRLVRAAMPDGESELYRYDPAGRLVAFERSTAARWMFGYDLAGRLVQLSGPLGVKATLRYDERGLLAGYEDGLGRMTTYGYDTAGRLTATRDPAGQTWRREYDANGRLLAMVDPAARRVKLTYDALGNLASVERADGPVLRFVRENGRVARIEGPAGGSVRVSYDAAGRPVATQYANGEVFRRKLNAAGQAVEIADALGHAWKAEYSAARQLAAVSEPAGGQFRYAYTDSGHLERITDARGQSRVFRYDTLGRKNAETDALGRTTELEFGPGGTIREAKPADGQTARIEYDLLGRPTRIAYATGPAAQYGYDAVGNVVEESQGDYRATYRYDALDRVVEATYQPANQTVHHEYDAAGRRTAMEVVGVGRWSYEYDERDDLVQLRDPQGRVTRFGYDAAGRVTTQALPNGITLTRSYDGRGRVRTLAARSASNEALLDRRYEYDSAGNLVQELREGGVKLAYGYDANGRLLAAEGPGVQERLAWDPVGNRLLPNDDAKYDAADQVMRFGRETFKHDAAGRLLTRDDGKQKWQYVYDAAGRLASVKRDGTVAAEYGYDTRGRRIWKKTKGETRYYVYDGIERLVELDATRQVVQTWTTGPELDRPVSWMLRGEVRYPFADLVASVVATADERGTITGRWDYAPFGELRKPASRTDSPNLPPLAFAGKTLDAESGLYWFGARDYDAGLGRFVSPDPVPGALSNPPSLHAYQYAMNNPLRYRDPTGRAPMDIANSIDKSAAGVGDSIGPTLGRVALNVVSLGARGINWFRGDEGAKSNERLGNWIGSHAAPVGKASVQMAAGLVTEPLRLGQATGDMRGSRIDAGQSVPAWDQVKTVGTEVLRGAAVIGPIDAGLNLARAGVRGGLGQLADYGRASAGLAEDGVVIPARQVPTLGDLIPGPSTGGATYGSNVFVNANWAPQFYPQLLAHEGLHALVNAVIETVPTEIGRSIVGAIRNSSLGTAIEETAAWTAQLMHAQTFGGPMGNVFGRSLTGVIVDEAGQAVTLPTTISDVVRNIGTNPNYLGLPPALVNTLVDVGVPLAAGAGVGVSLLPYPALTKTPDYLRPGSPAPTGEQLASAQGLAGQAGGGVPGVDGPRIPKGGQQGVPQGGYQDPPPGTVKPEVPPRDRLPPDMCPVVEEAGNVQVWVPCPPGIFPGTPIPRQGPKRPGDRAGVTIAGASAPTLPVVPGTPPEGIGKTPPVTPPTTPPINPPIPPVVIGQTPPATPPTIPPRTPPATPQTPPATGAQCSAPLCLEMCQKNCESFMASYGDCSKSCLGLKSCGLSNFKLKEVKAACYLNMLTRCNQGMAGGSGGWCVKKGADASCEARAQRVCGCPVATHPQCKGEWGDG